MADETKNCQADQTKQCPDAKCEQCPLLGKPETAKSLIRQALEIVPSLQTTVEGNSKDIEAIKARSDALKSEKALTFSFFVWFYYFSAHLFFAFQGKTLILPEVMNQITWALIVGPWLGHGLGRFVNAMSDKFGAEKR